MIRLTLTGRTRRAWRQFKLFVRRDGIGRLDDIGMFRLRMRWRFLVERERQAQLQAQATLDRIQRCRSKAGYLACECRAAGDSECKWLARDKSPVTSWDIMAWYNRYGLSHDEKMRCEIADLERLARGEG